MALEIEGDLTRNHVDVDQGFANSVQHGRIVLRGTGASVVIRTQRGGSYFHADLDSGCSLGMAPNSYVNQFDVHLRGSSASLGENSFAIGRLRLYSHEPARIVIGRDCLIGSDTLCMTSDMHSIVTVETGTRINPPGDILIADHVWLGAECVILKGTTIGRGSMIAIRSVVMGEVPEHVLMAGYPARLVKSGVTWNEHLLPLDPQPPIAP
jgi:acetyltransferase-like isoleucine patch superfamily enzyme